MKKKKIILIFAIFIFSTSLTKVESSTDLDITNDTTIKYKWYIEEKVEGMYYPKGESLEGYYEDINDIKYGKESDLDEKYCQYSRDKYVVTMDVERIYKKIIDAQYVKIIGISEDTNIRIFANTTEINYSIRKMGTDEIIIDLNRYYELGILWFYIESEESFDMYLAFDERFTMISIYKHIENTKIIIPDETWIYKNSTYATMYTHENKNNNAFLTYTGQRAKCRAKEIQTYRYKIKRKYYDDQYYEYLNDYIPDYKNYIIEYNGELPTNTINITKTIKEIVPIKEYIYLETTENQQLNNQETNNITTEKCESTEKTKTKYIETEVIKEKEVIPSKIYYLIIILFLIILILLLTNIRKKSIKTNS